MTLPLVVPPAVTGMMFPLMLDGRSASQPRSLRARAVVAGLSDTRQANSAMFGFRWRMSGNGRRSWC
jgi:hypothetical protein